MYFTKRATPVNIDPLEVEGETVPYSDRIKYLGLMLTPKLQWTEHIKKTVTECQKRINFLRSLAGVRWGCHLLLLLTLYKTVV